ncbi:MAG: hypothetical protein IE885_06395 [Campylobacterales bacterium]|nr:hypothetical protein [Campylobacterales bacterium]
MAHPPKEKINALSTLLVSMDSDHISKDEARHLATDIFTETGALIKEFDLVSPPLFHNLLVNTGLRKGGLCYQWSDALYAHLRAENYQDFDFHLAVANKGEYLGEHNALVVVPKGGQVEEGVIIDPWRNSGKLYFSRFKEDKEYHWKHRLDRCQSE